MVIVEHHDDGGNVWWSEYLHLSAFSVEPGDRVEAGEPIGLSGNTGTKTTGPHLHLQIRVSGAWLASHRLPSTKVYRTEKKGLIYVDPLAIGLVPPTVPVAGVAGDPFATLAALGAGKPSPVKIKAWCRWQGTQAAGEWIIGALLIAGFAGWIRLPSR